MPRRIRSLSLRLSRPTFVAVLLLAVAPGFVSLANAGGRGVGHHSSGYVRHGGHSGSFGVRSHHGRYGRGHRSLHHRGSFHRSTIKPFRSSVHHGRHQGHDRHRGKRRHHNRHRGHSLHPRGTVVIDGDSHYRHSPRSSVIIVVD